MNPGQIATLLATALLGKNDEHLMALRQTMIESRAIANAAELDYLDYKRAVELARQLQAAPEVIEVAGCSRRCLYCSSNCPHR